MKKLYIILFCFLTISLLQARVLTFEEAVNIALTKSYTIKSFEQSKLEAQASYNFYKAEFKPRMDFEMWAPTWHESVTPIQQTNGLPVYNTTGSFQVGGDLSFTYMLPTGGNLQLSSTLYRDNLSTSLALQDYQTLKTTNAYSRLAVTFNQPIFTANEKKEYLLEAKYYNDRTISQFTREQMNIVYSVTELFYSLYYDIRQLEIAEEQLTNAEEAYRIAQIREKNGRAPEIDVLNTKVKLASSQGNVSESKNRVEYQQDYFKQKIGIPLDEEINIMTNLQYDTFTIDMDKAIESALANRHELFETDIDLQLQQIQVNRAKRYSEFKGEITAFYDMTGVSTIGSGTTHELFESSFDNFVDRKPNRGVMFTVTYPILDWGRSSTKRQKAQAALKNTQLRAEDLQKEIIREVRDVVRSVNEAKQRLGIYRENQNISEMTYSISRMRFENGDISSQDLAQQQEQLAGSQLEYLNAFVTYQLQVADLKRKTLWNFQEGASYLVGEND